jgi:predicted DNA-binding transcriptional regulator
MRDETDLLKFVETERATYEICRRFAISSFMVPRRMEALEKAGLVKRTVRMRKSSKQAHYVRTDKPYEPPRTLEERNAELGRVSVRKTFYEQFRTRRAIVTLPGGLA